MNIQISKESLNEKKWESQVAALTKTTTLYMAAWTSFLRKSDFDSVWLTQQQSCRKFINVFQTTTNDFVESGVKIYNACPENLYF